MIGWWLLGEMLQRQSPWTIPNLLATTFYGERAYRAGFIIATWSGLAGTFAVYCVAGVLFAIAGRERKGNWVLVLVGVTTGLALNWFCFGVVLRRVNPMVQIYSPDRLIVISHLLYGAALGTYPGFARQLQSVAESGLPASGVAVHDYSAIPVPPPIPEGAATEHSGSDQDVGGRVP